MLCICSASPRLQRFRSCQEQMAPSCTGRGTNTTLLRSLEGSWLLNKDEKRWQALPGQKKPISRPVFNTGLACDRCTAWTWFQGCSPELAELHPAGHRQTWLWATSSFWILVCWRNQRAGHIPRVEWISSWQKITFSWRTAAPWIRKCWKGLHFCNLSLCLRVPSG